MSVHHFDVDSAVFWSQNSWIHAKMNFASIENVYWYIFVQNSSLYRNLVYSTPLIILANPNQRNKTLDPCR